MSGEMQEDPNFKPGSEAEVHYNALSDSAAFAQASNVLRDKALADQDREIEFYFRRPTGEFHTIQELVSEKEYEMLLGKLGEINLGEDKEAARYLSIASNLKEFDDSRFPPGFIAYSTKMRLARLLGYYAKQPGNYIRAAHALRILDQEYLYSHVKFGEKWDMFAKAIKDKRQDWGTFLDLYVKAASLNFSEISDRVPIDEDWGEIVKAINGKTAQFVDFAAITANAQAVTPAGKDPIFFTSFDWNRCASELKNRFQLIENVERYVLALMPVIESANTVKYVKVTGLVRRLLE